MDAIFVENLVKSYASKDRMTLAVDHITFSVKKGEIFGFLGPNGAGKSTTINILSGTLSKDSGTVRILGKDPVIEHEYVRNRMNVASAYFGLTDVLTIQENLEIYSRLYGIKNRKERIAHVLSNFQLDHLIHKKTSTLSSGERTRLSLCKGFLNNPEVLLLDECTVGLDPSVAETTRSLIKQYNRKYKTTILFTSHYMYEVEELCSRIAFMNKGKIVTIDTASNLKQLIKKQTVEMTFVKKHPSLPAFFKSRDLTLLSCDDAHVIFELASEATLHELLHALYQKKFTIKDLQIHQPTLEDVFIKFSRP